MGVLLFGVEAITVFSSHLGVTVTAGRLTL